MVTVSCGTTPLARVFMAKISPKPRRLSEPSWMRAPPESIRPTIGAPVVRERSMTFRIFSATASLREPP
jgi:hypothetical protein